MLSNILLPRQSLQMTWRVTKNILIWVIYDIWKKIIINVSILHNLINRFISYYDNCWQNHLHLWLDRFLWNWNSRPHKFWLIFWIWLTLFKSPNDIKAISEWNLSKIIVERQLCFVFYLNYLRWRRAFFIVRSYGKISFIGVDYMPFDCVVWNVHNSCGLYRLFETCLIFLDIAISNILSSFVIVEKSID